MQTEERSICPSCGGDNPKAAAFCWRCYANMPPAPLAPGQVGAEGNATRSFGRLGVPTMPNPPSMPVPPTSSGGPSTLARVIVGAAASLIAVFGVRSLLDHGPSLPDVLAGTPRITTQEMKDFEKEMIENGKSSNLDVAAGAYGTGAIPAFVVLLVEGRTDEGTDAIFNEFVGGMTSGGATVETNAGESGQYQGVEYRCVPVAAPQVAAAACMWRDDGTVGIVFGIDAGIDETKDLLFKTYDEIA
jgi:hypothetical protein